MTTLTGHHAGATAPYGRTEARWREQHPVAATLGLIVAAIVCGVLLGLLIDAASSGPATTIATHHAGGAHGRAAVLARVQESLTAENAAAQSRAAAAQARQTTAQSDLSSNRIRVKGLERTPARGGFAVGRGHVGTGSVAQ